MMQCHKKYFQQKCEAHCGISEAEEIVRLVQITDAAEEKDLVPKPVRQCERALRSLLTDDWKEHGEEKQRDKVCEVSCGLRQSERI